MAQDWELTKNLLGGKRCRVLRAPAGTAYTGNISEIINLIADDGAAKSPWIDFGYVGDTSYNQEFEDEEYAIRGEVIDREINSTRRTFAVVLHEITPEHLQIAHPGSTITTVAAVANASGAQRRVRCGPVETLPRHMIAFVGKRKVRGTGTAVTHGTMSRGPYVAGVLPSAELSPDEDTEVEFPEDGYVSLPVQFDAYSDNSLGAQVDWIEETPGAIPTV
jgi:hypothetical protein